jgi:hypothetical protein
LSGVNRTARLVALLCAGLPLTACATFTESDLAARVGDAELDYDEFEDRLAQVSESSSGRVVGENGRAVVSNWVALELARPVGLIDLYSAGPTESGVLCVSVVTVADTATADVAVADLRGGADWAAFVTDTDPLATLDGRQPCLPTSELGEFADQLSGMTVDNPYAALTFPEASGSVVLQMQQVSDVNGFELLQVYQTVDPDLVEEIVGSVADADVYIDPKLGSFDPERFGVAPLG